MALRLDSAKKIFDPGPLIYELVRIIAGFDDVTVMGQSVQQRRHHLCISKDIDLSKPAGRSAMVGFFTGLHENMCLHAQAYNDSSGSIAEFLQGGVMASAEKIGTVPLVCAAVVVSVFAWMFANSPVDTGKRVGSKVLQCENRRRSCVVQLGDSGPLILMPMPQGAVGQSLVIGVSRLRFTGRAYYWQAH